MEDEHKRLRSLLCAVAACALLLLSLLAKDSHYDLANSEKAARESGSRRLDLGSSCDGAIEVAFGIRREDSAQLRVAVDPLKIARKDRVNLTLTIWDTATLSVLGSWAVDATSPTTGVIVVYHGEPYHLGYELLEVGANERICSSDSTGANVRGVDTVAD